MTVLLCRRQRKERGRERMVLSEPFVKDLSTVVSSDRNPGQEVWSLQYGFYYYYFSSTQTTIGFLS